MADRFILLVEDNPDDVTLTRRAFRKHDIPNEVVVARDGVEALDYLFGSGKHAGRDVREQPQVILMDIKLPRVSGLQVLERIRSDARTRTLPVVLLTSSAEERDVREAYRLGCNSYIRKPVDFTTFTDAVRQLGRYWLVLNEPPPSTA